MPKHRKPQSAPRRAPAPSPILVAGAQPRKNATAKTPAPRTAIKGTTSFNTIVTAAIKAASAQGRTDCDHDTGIAMLATVGVAAAGNTVEDAGLNTGSATTTRICGAEQWGQKATPSSTACPHL